MTITLTEAQHRLHTIVESEGKIVRGGRGVNCRYFNDDMTPSCLVGTAFASELTEAGVTPADSSNEDNVQGLVDHGLIAIEPLALDYLTWAQDSQDSGNPWRTAVQAADEYLAERLASQQLIDVAV